MASNDQFLASLLTLKIVAVVTAAIIVVDLEVLRKTVHEFHELKTYLDEEPYN